MSAEYVQGDIHKEILQINDNIVNLIYTSPPYGITEAEWDKPLDWDMLFPEMWRVLKPNGIIVLHDGAEGMLQHCKPVLDVVFAFVFFNDLAFVEIPLPESDLVAHSSASATPRA